MRQRGTPRGRLKDATDRHTDMGWRVTCSSLMLKLKEHLMENKSIVRTPNIFL
jgi:hypothetical protein